MESIRIFFGNEEYENSLIVILFVVLIFSPFGFIFQQGPDWHQYQILAAIWVYRDWSNVHGDASIGFSFPDPFAFLGSLFLNIFGYIFAYQIVRHHRGQIIKKMVRLSAILTLIPYLPFFILTSLGVQLSAGGGISGPIPLFLVLGLIIDRLWGKEPPEQPWDEEDALIEKEEEL